ncbi:2'(,)3'-cyclic-nucleotide 2'-phosphodiesterase/5'- or 3'-nucleotidase(,) 5'-nucleotidase family [Parelusimicrobium proximum]|uniref:bifunctional metallophosphatase/5'-nucleotidase n=1 Tax=Parelusimicrobium proximum TaxID=3228953 RepID=UPI003D18259E
MKKLTLLTAVILLSATLISCKNKSTESITVFYISDASGMYWSRAEPDYGGREVGGYAVLKRLLMRERAPYILLSGGNSSSGTAEGLIDKGALNVSALNILGAKVAALGSEDLELGLDTMSANLQAAKYVTTSSNFKSASLPSVKSHYILSANGLKIGVFSFIPKESGPKTSRTGGINISDEIAAAKETVKELKEKTDFIILLLNSDLEDIDMTEENLSEEIEGIDVILSSSDESLEGYRGAVSNNTLIGKVSHDLRSAGRLKINLDKEKNITSKTFENIILYKDKYGEDAEIKEMTDTLKDSANKKLNNVVAKSESNFAAENNAETSLGAALSECIRTWGRTDFAILNSDSIREGIKEGPVTDYDLYKMYPYNDNIMTVKIRGEEIKRILESTLISPNNFAQTSGITVEYDSSLPQYKKIKKIRINGSEPKGETIYRLTTTDHIVAGGFGTDDFINVVEFKNTKTDLRTVLRSCIARKKVLTDKGFTPSWKDVKK